MTRVRDFLHGLSMAMGMFTAIPWPRKQWVETAIPWMLPAMPLVGLVVGVLWWAISALLAALSVPVPLAAAAYALLPMLLTGGLHWDGFMDTSDALLSRRSQEEKQRILKDPHTGAFAVISLGVLMLVQYAAALSLLARSQPDRGVLVLAVFSRALTAGMVLYGTPLPQSSYAKLFATGTTPIHRAMMWGCLLGCIIAAAWMGGWRMVGVLGIAAAAFCTAVVHARRQLGGINGDVAGYGLTLAEACGLVALAIL